MFSSLEFITMMMMIIMMIETKNKSKYTTVSVFSVLNNEFVFVCILIKMSQNYLNIRCIPSHVCGERIGSSFKLGMIFFLFLFFKFQSQLSTQQKEKTTKKTLLCTSFC